MRLLSYTLLTSQHVPASPLDISVGPEIEVMCLGLQPFDPQGINSSWGIGCKHNGIRHPARGVCCIVSLRCDIHAYCCWDIYWIKADDVVLLYFFSRLRDRTQNPAELLRKQKLISRVCISKTKLKFILDLYPNTTSASVCLMLLNVIIIMVLPWQQRSSSTGWRTSWDFYFIINTIRKLNIEFSKTFKMHY